MNFRRNRIWLTLILATLFLIAVPTIGSAGAAAPANDNFADAEILTGLPTLTTGSSIDATRETDEPDHGSFGLGSSVWYDWTAPSSGPVVIDLSGSDYDTFLAVYTGDTLTSLSLVGEDDDGGTGLDSKLAFSAVSGVTYRIAVDGFGGATGPLQLAIYVSGSISGTVTDSSGTPLGNICVDAFDEGGEEVGSSLTDSSGNYTVIGLRTANYRLKFYGCGGNNVVYEYYKDKPTLASANPVAVTAGSDTPNIDAELAPGGSISGTVTDSSAAPLEDICVDLYDSSDGGVGLTFTDASGNYTFNGLGTGDYRLRFRGCGSNNVFDEYYNNQSTLAAADPVSVTAGSDTSGIDAELTVAGSISGTVTDTSGTPLEDICVEAYDSNDDVAGYGYTDASGSYTINGIAAGNYRILFLDCGSNNVVREFYDDKSNLAAADPVSVTVGSDTSGIDAELAEGGSISGTVTDASSNPLEGICVYAYDEAASDYLTDAVAGDLGTDSSGNYTVGSLGTGDYRILFLDCGSNDVAGEFYNNKSTLAAADPVSVTAGSDVSGIDAELAEGGSISGTVTDASGTPLEGICVYAYDEAASEYTTDVVAYDLGTDSSGNYTVGSLGTGDYRILFLDCGSNNVVREFYDNKSNLAAADPVSVTVGSDTSGIDAELLTPTQHTLTTASTGSGQGTITSSPAGIDCGTDCSKAFDDGTSVTLTANPAPGSTFTGWSGAGCSGAGTCQVSVASDQTATATFTANPPTQHTLTTASAGSGQGTITSSPAGIDCGASCSKAFDDGTSVTLTANPAPGSTFTGWSGAGCSGAGTCQVSVASDQTATATFTANPAVDPPVVDPPVVDPPVGKAKIGKVKVKGPAKAKKSKKATYKVKISNSGNAEATGVRLKVSGRGLTFNTSVGVIEGGTTRTVKVKVKPKKPGKIKASFKVTSKNAGGKTVKKKITVKK